MAKLTILDQSGHTELAFKTADPASVKAAMAQFDELVKNHKHWAYKVNPDGSKESIKKFDETAEEIIIHPQMVGG